MIYIGSIFLSIYFRKLHDMKVQRLAERNKRNPDIARFLPVVVLSVCCVSIIVTIKIQNPTFLTSQSGYVNAVSINQHFLEAKYLKDFLQNGTSNFWFPDNSLGYPMYVTLQPLPGFVTALAFILFERWLIFLFNDCNLFYFNECTCICIQWKIYQNHRLCKREKCQVRFFSFKNKIFVVPHLA